MKTVNYGSYLLDPPDTHFQARNWDDVWDLTKGDATVSYTIDMNGIVQPESWYGSTDPATYPDWFNPWVEVGMRGVGGDNYNPGPANTYQGKCGGWMTSESDDWLGARDENGVLVNDGQGTQDGDDKHSLTATSNVGEKYYDVEDDDGAFGFDAG